MKKDVPIEVEQVDKRKYATNDDEAMVNIELPSDELAEEEKSNPEKQIDSKL